MSSWNEDVLGPGFSQKTLPLSPNEDGPGVATLIRHEPQNDPAAYPHTPSTPRFSLLYVHGWNDYFYQVEVARTVSQAGGAFYAIDLRAYGRSLQPHQTPGWTSDLRSYDEDLHWAIKTIRTEHPELPLVLGGHSTGGLTVSFWADRHPGAIDGLVLNSPWLDLQASPLMQKASVPVVSTISTFYDPRSILPLPNTDTYHRTLTGYRDENEKIPISEEDDQFWAPGGWNPNPKWRGVDWSATRAGWLWAVLEAQDFVARGMHIDCPIFVLHSARSVSGPWSDDYRHGDGVLDVTQIRERAIKLGNFVTISAIDGAIHDVFLSRRPVRQVAFAQLQHWLQAYVVNI